MKSLAVMLIVIGSLSGCAPHQAQAWQRFGQAMENAGNNYQQQQYQQRQLKLQEEQVRLQRMQMLNQNRQTNCTSQIFGSSVYTNCY